MNEATGGERSPEKDIAQQSPRRRFAIIGMGASSGGLAAFESFFSTMPVDGNPEVAFVLVQHLAPDHKSILTELIRRCTTMQVFEVEDGMEVQPNCAYIIPPNRDMKLVNGRLRLVEPSLARGLRLPIDYFFRSLAQDQREQAICIVLSGTGSDGALGVRAVKGEGGMVMVQAPETTQYDGMPRQAIATGMVDFVLPPHEMPDRLLAYVRQTTGAASGPSVSTDDGATDPFDRIFYLLRNQTGHDFSQYKRSTIRRRVERRMAVHQIARWEEYVRYLQITPGEVEELFRDLLIGVTHFFRDGEVFQVVQEQVVPKLLARKAAGGTVRVWVPGCSTGEEAYSIAILFREQQAMMEREVKVQIFATDIDREAIEQARAGVYPASIIADVSPERLAQYFEQEQPDGSRYRVRKVIREMLVFSEHDLIKDPPFSKLDLISCRNVLIYMGSELQKKVIPLFHYALQAEGVLLLGASESIGEFEKLFGILDRKSKLFERKRDEQNQPRGALAKILPRHQQAEGGPGQRPETTVAGRPSWQELTAQTLLSFYAAVGALVNERGEILYLLGRTGRYLEPAPGEPVMNIFRMARQGLRSELTVALHRAVSQGVPSRYTGLVVATEGGGSTVNVTVLPVTGDEAHPLPRGLFLVLIEEIGGASTFQSTESAGDTAAEGLAAGTDLDSYILRLKEELRAKEEYLHTTIAELEMAQEELRTTQEDMQSVKEEMQSTNEELETSKEELHSLNEELTTVNNELQAKVADLSRSNNDMKNLLSGTGIGTLFVDLELRILRFTPGISVLLNLIDGDMGRPLDQIRSNLVGYAELVTDIREVLQTLTVKELEVESQSGAWFLLRILPYRTLENVIEGAVITFTEISAMKKAQATLRDSEALQRLAVVVRDTRDAVLVQDMQGRILAWNPAAEKLYGWTEQEALAMNIRQLMPEESREEAVAAMQSLCREGGFQLQQLRRKTKEGRILQVEAVVAGLSNAAGENYGIATTERFQPGLS